MTPQLPDDNDGCGIAFILIMVGIALWVIGQWLEALAQAH